MIVVTVHTRGSYIERQKKKDHANARVLFTIVRDIIADEQRNRGTLAARVCRRDASTFEQKERESECARARARERENEANERMNNLYLTMEERERTKKD